MVSAFSRCRYTSTKSKTVHTFLGLTLLFLLSQFAKAAGATVIATTSSSAKADRLKKLGADHIINYKTDPNWGGTARKLTGDVGVDHIIEVGGPGTLQQSFKCIKLEGVISVIGFLGQADPRTQPTVMDTLMHLCTVRGIYVGSKAMMQDMVRAIEANDIHPVVDEKVFTLEQTRDAYDYMVSLLVSRSPLLSGYMLTVWDTVGSETLRKGSDQDCLRRGSITTFYLVFLNICNESNDSNWIYQCYERIIIPGIVYHL